MSPTLSSMVTTERTDALIQRRFLRAPVRGAACRAGGFRANRANHRVSAAGTSLEDRPRYTPSSTFETFPFPEGLRPNLPAKHYAADPRAKAIAAAAKRLDELRNNWLNPPDLVRMA